MTDWTSVPVFGDPSTDGSSTIRPSAYGLIGGRRGRIAVVRTPLGLFLPGGGSDGTETPEATVMRETLEECATRLLAPPGHRWAVEQWLKSGAELSPEQG